MAQLPTGRVEHGPGGEGTEAYRYEWVQQNGQNPSSQPAGLSLGELTPPLPLTSCHLSQAERRLAGKRVASLRTESQCPPFAQVSSPFIPSTRPCAGCFHLSPELQQPSASQTPVSPGLGLP